MACRRSLVAAGIALWALASCAPQAPDVVLSPPAPEIIAADAGDVVDAGEIVVLLHDSAAAGRLEASAGAAGYVLSERHTLGALSLEMLTFRIPTGTGPREAIAALEALEPGSTAGVNHAYRPAIDPSEARRYADALIRWPRAGCAALVPVGVIDGDVDREANPLSGAEIALWQVAGTTGGREHGTAVAELLAGPGRLSAARLHHAAVVEPVAGADPAAGVDAILRALDWMGGNGVRLVNVSLAGPYNKILDRGLQAAAADGMIIVAAAGNAGPGGPPRYPAALATTIAVTAVDADRRPYRRAPEAGYVDVAAPGVDVFIESAAPARYMSGTSLAAPYVTAAIAADPEAAALRSVDDVRSWLARVSLDLGAAGRDARFGSGLLALDDRCAHAAGAS